MPGPPLSVAAGPHEARFDGTDQWVAGRAERPAERAEGRDAPGAYQPGRERREHARGERREHEVAEGDLELWHALSLARCAESFSGSEGGLHHPIRAHIGPSAPSQGAKTSTASVCENPALGPPPIT